MDGEGVEGDAMGHKPAVGQEGDMELAPLLQSRLYPLELGPSKAQLRSPASINPVPSSDGVKGSLQEVAASSLCVRKPP